MEAATRRRLAELTPVDIIHGYNAAAKSRADARTAVEAWKDELATRGRDAALGLADEAAVEEALDALAAAERDLRHRDAAISALRELTPVRGRS
jgi:hypothetical protein